MRPDPGNLTSQSPPRRRCRARGPVLARERAGAYLHDATEHGHHDEELGPSLRDAAIALRGAARELLARVVDGSRPHGGELGGLLDLLAAIDTAQASAVELADQVLDRDTAERTAGLSLEALLAAHSRLTFGDRRTLTGLAELLRGMPNLRAAFQAGVVGFATLRAIASEARVLDAQQRASLDAGFADQDRLAAMDPDQQADAVAQEVARLRPKLAEKRELRRIERRYLHLAPDLDGGLTIQGELDPEAGSTLLAALDAAAPPPTADRDVTRGAADDPLMAVATGALGADRRHDGDGHTAPDGAHGGGGSTRNSSDRLGQSCPAGRVRGGSDTDDERRGASADAVEHPTRTRARQRADALTAIAERFLAGGSDGGARRARPRVLVWTDVNTMTGHDEVAAATRLLWSTVGAPVALTPAAARRLSSDAELRFVLHDDGQVLAVSGPVPTIPRRIRSAVTARDQGCRFPGCSAPIHWCDLHHVVAREEGGPTVVDNLVAVCRRHHTAVTQGRWRLSMTSDGTVTVKRGRRAATRLPPHRRSLGAA